VRQVEEAVLIPNVTVANKEVAEGRAIRRVGWPEPEVCTVYDRIFGDFSAKNTACKPYIYGSGQPKLCVIHTLCEHVTFHTHRFTITPYTHLVIARMEVG